MAEKKVHTESAPSVGSAEWGARVWRPNVQRFKVALGLDRIGKPERDLPGMALARKHIEGEDLIQIALSQDSLSTHAERGKAAAKKRARMARGELLSAGLQIGRLAVGLPADSEANVDLPAVMRKGIQAQTEVSRQKQRIREARGSLPWQSLRAERALIAGAEQQQARQHAAGLEILKLFNDRPLEELISIDTLRDATALAKVAHLSETVSLNRLLKLRDRLIMRFPDRRDELVQGYDAIYDQVQERKSQVKLLSREAIRDLSSPQAREWVDQQAKVILEATGLHPSSEIYRSLMRSLGIEEKQVKGGKKYLVATPVGQFHKLLIHTRAGVLGGQELLKVLKLAKKDPRLAEQAVTVALLARADQRAAEIKRKQIERKVKVARFIQDSKIEVQISAASTAQDWDYIVENAVNPLVSGALRFGNKLGQLGGQGLGKSLNFLGKVLASPGRFTSWMGRGVSGFSQDLGESVDRYIRDERSRRSQEADRKMRRSERALAQLKSERVQLHTSSRDVRR